MAFRLDIPDMEDAVAWTLKDLNKLMNPYTVGGFFKEMRLREAINKYVILLWALLSMASCAFLNNWMYLSVALFVALLMGLWYGNYMDRLLLLLGLSVFFGYCLHFIYFAPVVYALITSIKLGYVYWMAYVFVPVVMSLVLHLRGERLVWRVVGNEESSPLALYAMAPALITGIFRLFHETVVIHYIFLAYSIFILYKGIKITFGFERVIYIFLTLMLTASITAMLLLVSSTSFLGIPTPYY